MSGEAPTFTPGLAAQVEQTEKQLSDLLDLYRKILTAEGRDVATAIVAVTVAESKRPAVVAQLLAVAVDRLVVGTTRGGG